MDQNIIAGKNSKGRRVIKYRNVKGDVVMRYEKMKVMKPIYAGFFK
jgi:hypothetical protein